MGRFFEQPAKKFFFESSKAVAAYCKRHCPKECADIIANADQVVNQRFQFNLRWDMERTYQAEVFQGDIDWLHQPGDDPEWIFAFNRMRFWICLGQAYALTGDETYAQTFADQLAHWVRTVKRDDPKNQKAWRSIEAGLRMEYWLKAMCYFQDSPAITPEITDLFIDSVTEHAEFIMGIWNTYNLMSNWGVLANHGLFLAGVMLPDSHRTGDYITTAMSRLEKEIRMQVYRDGVQWEQSPMYHNEVLHCFLDVVLLAKRNNIVLPDCIFEKTHAMCKADLYAGKPDHNELSMGDSDEIDQRDLISKGAYLFKDGILKFGGYQIPDFDTAWDIGELGLEDYAKLDALPPEVTDYNFSDSGNAYFRSSWAEDATFVHFHCGPLGAGHGHADQLHVDIFSRGEDVLVDAGRCSYVFGTDRIAFKEVRAHNTVMVDDRDYYVCKDAWENHDLTRSINQTVYAGNRYGYAQGGHLAYMAPEGVYVNRRVIYLKPDILVIADEFYGEGHHSYQQFFHLNNAGTLSGQGDLYTYRSEKVKGEICFVTPGLTSQVIPTRLSRHYNQSEPNSAITTAFSGTGFVSAYTVIALSDPENREALQVCRQTVTSNFKGITFDSSQVEALDIRFGLHSFTVVIAHQEFASPTDTFSASGCTGFGSAVVFDRTAGEEEIGTVLQW